MDAAADEGNFKLQPDELSPEEVEEDTKGN
jgi:hypothetical protein